jgi:hypothetical protein
MRVPLRFFLVSLAIAMASACTSGPKLDRYGGVVGQPAFTGVSSGDSMRCPAAISRPYDDRLAEQDGEFMRVAQFTIVSDGYGREPRRMYVSTPLGDQILQNMRKTMADRAAACRSHGYQPFGFVPPIFGVSAYGIPE